MLISDQSSFSWWYKQQKKKKKHTLASKGFVVTCLSGLTEYIAAALVPPCIIRSFLHFLFPVSCFLIPGFITTPEELRAWPLTCNDKFCKHIQNIPKCHEKAASSSRRPSLCPLTPAHEARLSPGPSPS